MKKVLLIVLAKLLLVVCEKTGNGICMIRMGK